MPRRVVGTDTAFQVPSGVGRRLPQSFLGLGAMSAAVVPSAFASSSVLFEKCVELKLGMPRMSGSLNGNRNE